MLPFRAKLTDRIARTGSLLCVGLDPEAERIPAAFGEGTAAIRSFNQMVVEATHDLVCAYKPNFAFYERFGPRGLEVLAETVQVIPDEVVTIADAKRGDIANTAQGYAQAVFDVYGFDSVTVNPYMGLESLAPFLEREGRGVWVLCRTSNPGAVEFQALPTADGPSDEPLFMRVARSVAGVGAAATCGLVVGATDPRALELVRAVAPDLPLLVPGIGPQGGDLTAAVRAHGSAPVVINASRSILFPEGTGPTQAAVREAALRVRDRIQSLL
ncbi:MAG: orotidine-5'-phosphate decarboxylase [Chloroflexota bacterium]|nr:orotidine-5'-phosphate decarboxylase [Chloroflexota bacterium]